MCKCLADIVANVFMGGTAPHTQHWVCKCGIKHGLGDKEYTFYHMLLHGMVVCACGGKFTHRGAGVWMCSCGKASVPDAHTLEAIVDRCKEEQEK